MCLLFLCFGKITASYGPVDELESARKDVDKIRNLRDEVARLKNLIVSTRSSICGDLLDSDSKLALYGDPSRSARERED